MISSISHTGKDCLAAFGTKVYLQNCVLIQGTLHLSVAKMLSKFDRCPVLWMSPFYYRWIKSPHTIGFILHFLWLVNDVHESRLTELLGLTVRRETTINWSMRNICPRPPKSSPKKKLR